jgi:hypothetical protein
VYDEEIICISLADHQHQKDQLSKSLQELNKLVAGNTADWLATLAQI